MISYKSTMADPPPVLSISEINKPRFNQLKSDFKNVYGKLPAFFARASGRVNLIGEHIDYCGYAVLPMAIEQDIVIAVRTNDSGLLNLSNTNNEFESFSSPVDKYEIDKSNPRWQHYFLCGYRGILEHFGLERLVGMDLLLDGTVPRSAGLSSSSALVCCAALATLRANGKQCSKLELADLCQHSEKYIGTEGGGMDQAISFLAEPGTAKLIEFNPLRTTDVGLPPGANFVISNCCVEMNKAATSHYNIRVTECRLAAQLLAKAKGVDWRSIRKLGDLQKDLGVTLEDMVQLVKDTLHLNPYSKQEICDILTVTEDELAKTSLNEKTIHIQSFKLYDRALHVYSEASRVHQFKSVCDSSHQGALEELGRLMDASHDSCSRLYECSCPELDRLTQIARESGALGSRLTGAGWGGCAVSLVHSDSVATFLQQMHDGYYANDSRSKDLVKESLFSTRPGGGACFFLIETT